MFNEQDFSPTTLEECVIVGADVDLTRCAENR